MPECIGFGAVKFGIRDSALAGWANNSIAAVLENTDFSWPGYCVRISHVPSQQIWKTCGAVVLLAWGSKKSQAQSRVAAFLGAVGRTSCDKIPPQH